MGRYPGELEQMILVAVLRGGNRAYGVEIIEQIEAGSGRRVGSGALSVSLDRVERKGLVRTFLGDPDEVRGGRPRRYVEVTPVGMEIVRETRAALLALWEGLDRVLPS